MSVAQRKPLPLSLIKLQHSEANAFELAPPSGSSHLAQIGRAHV